MHCFVGRRVSLPRLHISLSRNAPEVVGLIDALTRSRIVSYSAVRSGSEGAGGQLDSFSSSPVISCVSPTVRPFPRLGPGGIIHTVELYTIGYEGISQEALFETLLQNGVQVLIDIRELPLSRRPGFSKSKLAGAALSYGLKYDHIRALGTPRDIRYRRKIDHDYEAFKQGFLAHLAEQDKAMEALVARALTERCCLLCYEGVAEECHRWFVAERAKGMSAGRLTVVHLSAG